MDSSLVERAQLLHTESELVEERLSFIDKQVSELTEFLSHLAFIATSSETNFFSSLGKGIFLEAQLRSKELYVEAGAGVLIKKSLPDVQMIIRSQITNLAQLRTESQQQLGLLHNEFETLVSQIENARKSSGKTI